MCEEMVTLVKAVLVLIALGTATCHAVEPAHQTARLGSSLLAGVVGVGIVVVVVVVVVVAAGEVLDEIHDDERFDVV
jgi:hypothetical protein